MGKNKSINKIVIFLIIIIVFLVLGSILLFSKVYSNKCSLEHENSNQHLNGENSNNIYNPNEDFTNFKDDYRYLYDKDKMTDSDLLLKEYIARICDNNKKFYLYGDVTGYNGPGSTVYAYLANRDNISIVLTYPTDKVESTGVAYGDIYVKGTYELTTTEIKQFFNEMTDIGNTDNFPSYVGAFDGNPNESIINIYYTLGGVKHNVSLVNGMMHVQNSTDGNVYYLLEFLNVTEKDKNICLPVMSKRSSSTISNILNRLSGK